MNSDKHNANSVSSILSRLKEIASAVMRAAEADTLAEVFERIADVSRELVGAKYAALGIPDGEGGLRYFAVSGVTAKQIAQIGNLPTGRGLLGAIMSEPHPLRLANMRDDPRGVGFPEHHPPMTSLLGVPIRLGDQLFGMLYLCDRVDGQPFSEDDETLIEMMAGYAALAIVGSQAKAQERRLTLLEERERISMELHDGVIQSLYAIGMQVELLREAVQTPTDDDFKHVLRQLDTVIEDIRSYIRNLNRRGDHQISVRECMMDLLTRLNVPETIAVTLNAPDAPAPVADPVFEALCQMTYEAISNVVRHAKADRLELVAAQFGDTFRIQITDNGKGFDQAEIDKQAGLGLRNIQQRAQLHGGTVEIASQPGAGTTVTINLPLNREL